MCSVDWLVVLEYLKVILSWPPIALVLGLLFINRFRRSIDDFLARVVEGNIFGQAFKAVPPQQKVGDASAQEDRLTAAAGAAKDRSSPTLAGPGLPPELAADPMAPAAVEYIRTNPAQTLIEYKRVLFSYHAERLFMRIYGTQIALLEYLKENPNRKRSLAELAQFHEEHQKKSGSTEYQLRDYFGFLVSFGVLSVEGSDAAHEYSITESGLEFLSYIRANYPTNWNQKAF